MKKLLNLFIIIFFLIISIRPAAALEAKTYRVGAFDNFPVIFEDTDGVIKGLYVDILTEIGKKEDIKFEYVFGTWSEGLDRIKNNEVDLLTSVGYTEERALYMDYTKNPLLTVWGELYTPKASKITSILQVENKKVRILTGDINAKNFQDLVSKFEIHCEFVDFSTYDDVFKAVAEKKVDAGIAGITFGARNQSKYDLKSSGIVFNPLNIYFTTAKDKNPELINILDKYLLNWENQTNSDFVIAKQNWLGSPVTKIEVIPDWIKYTVILLGVITILAVFIIGILRFKIRRETNRNKLAKEALFNSRNRYRGLLDSLDAGVIIHNPDTSIITSNYQAASLLGLSEEQMRGSKATDPQWRFIHENNTPFTIEEYPVNQVISTKKAIINNSLGINRPNTNDTVWVNLNGFPLFNNKGELTEIVISFTNVTSQKNTEKQKTISELRYRRLFETAKDGIIILNWDSGMIIDVNNFLIDLLGYSKEEFLSKYIWEVGVFKDIAASKENFLTLQQKRYVRFEDLPLETKMGDIIEVEFIANSYEVGSEVVMQCNIRNITDRKKAEKLLAIENAKNDALLGSMGDGLIAVDTDMKIIRVNKMSETMLGWTESEMLGKTIFEVITIEDKSGKILTEAEYPMNMAKSKNTMVVTTSAGLTYYYVKKDKTRFSAAIIVTPIVIDNETIGYINVFRDNSIEVEIDKTKSEILSLAAHQLRTPLTALRWISERLLAGADGKLNEVQQQHADNIQKAAVRMVALLNSILNVSQLELGKFLNAPQVIDMEKIAKECIKDLEIQIKQKNINFKADFEKDLSVILADPKFIQIIINNLMANAIKYTNENGSITLKIFKKDQNIIIEVTDTGVGIPQDQQNKIFTKMFRATNAKNIESDGTGLGLYIIKEIAKITGNDISFTSEENKGSTFTYTIKGKEIIKKA